MLPLKTKVIAVEGDDGSGKGTVSAFLVERLRREDKTVLHIGPENLPPFARQIRDIVTGPNLKDTSSDVQAMLFTSYLLNIYDEFVKPNLGKYDYLVIDRTYLSTLVYQHDSELIRRLEPLLAEHMQVDILIYLSVTPGTGIERIKSRDGGLDDFERSFTLRLITRRHRLYEELYERINIPVKHHINANRTKTSVLLNIRQLVNNLVTQEEYG